MTVLHREEGKIMLVPVKRLANLKYHGWLLPGAYDRAWLEEEVNARLDQANSLVRDRTNGAAEICVWDALRSFEVQQHLFARELGLARLKYPELDEESLLAHVATYVRPPDPALPPPHTTGGAVDVTLLWRGDEGGLGEFDDFSDYGRADHFDLRPPTNDAEQTVADRRGLLRMAMLECGFVGIEEEWWHYEYGTRTWAQATQAQVLYDRIQKPPAEPFLAHGRSPISPRQVVDVHGVAHEFGSARSRAEALQGKSRAFYYARTRHPNERDAAELLAELTGMPDALLLPSGLSASVSAVAANVDRGSKVLVDSTVYYETRNAFEALAEREGWRVGYADFNALQEDRQTWEAVQATFCDHPRNWLLTLPDLQFVRRLAAVWGSKVIVDTSVQPLQPLRRHRLADIIVMSLSKYPTLGETMGGAVLGSELELEPIRRWTRDRGMVLPPEACATLSRHLRTLPDRMASVSLKAEAIADFLSRQDEIIEVRLPDLRWLKADRGGQIAMRFDNSESAQAVESVVGWNANLGRRFPLALACTFGASFTTFENFGSRSTSTGPKMPGSDYIDCAWVRLGIGHESLDSIISALQFSLNAARDNRKAA